MKVLFVLNFLRWGGIEVQVLNIINLYLKNGIIVDIWHSDKYPDKTYQKFLENRGVKIKYVSYLKKCNRRIFNLVFIFNLFNLYLLLKKSSFRLVLPFGYHNCVLMNFLKIFNTGTKIYFTERGSKKGFQKYKILVDILAYKFTDGIIFNSYHAKNDYDKYQSSKSNKIVIRNIVSKDFISNDNNIDWRFELGIPRDSVFFVMIANFMQYKDQITVLKAWALKKRKNAFLVFAGSNKEYKYWKPFNDIYTNYKGNNVKYVGSVSDSISLTRACDALILSSESEGCPNVILEAMSLGKPIIATNIVALNEIYMDVDYTYLFNIGDYEKLSEFIDVFINNAGLRSSLGELNLLQSKEYHKISNFDESYLSLIDIKET